MLQLWPVSRRVNRPGNENDPKLIEAVRLTKQRALKTIISVRNPRSYCDVRTTMMTRALLAAACVAALFPERLSLSAR
jgi:hypothetical protein